MGCTTLSRSPPASMLERLRAWYRRNTAALSIPEGHHFYCLPRSDGRAFEHGIELLNDDTTPIVFVLRVLEEEARLSHGDASVASALCHEKGGIIVPMASLQHAIETADRISQRATQEAWPLRCRAVSALGLA